MISTMFGRRRRRSPPTAAEAPGVVPGIAEEPKAAPAAPAARRSPVPPRNLRRGIEAVVAADPGELSAATRAGDRRVGGRDEDGEEEDDDMGRPLAVVADADGTEEEIESVRSRGTTEVTRETSSRGRSATAGCCSRPQ